MSDKDFSLSKTQLFTIIGISVVILYLFPQILGAVFAFFLMGIIPFTNYALPSWAMLTMMFVAVVLIVRWIMGQPLYIGSLPTQEKTARKIARKRVLAKTQQARQKQRPHRRPVKV